MKRTHLIASFGLALILLLTMVVPAVAAKRVDNGYCWLSFHYDWITDTDGNHWLIECGDNYGPSSNDYMYLRSDDAGVFVEGSSSSYEYDSRINMKRGIATMTNSYVNLTATASGNSSYYFSGGSHKEGQWNTYYEWGPGSLKGTVTVGSTVYTFNYTSTSPALYLEDWHYMV
jgi:hypothetical protein